MSGNSIRRRRKRPRDESYGYRSLFWLLRREAVLRVLFGSHVGTYFEQRARIAVARGSTRECVYAALLVLKTRSRARWYIGETSPAAEPCYADFAGPAPDKSPRREARDLSNGVNDRDHGETPTTSALARARSGLPVFWDRQS